MKNWGSGEWNSPDPQFFIFVPPQEWGGAGGGVDFKKTLQSEARFS